MYYADREVVMKAIKSNGLALRYAPQFQTDREVVMEAVKSSGYALECAPLLQTDKEVEMKAVKNNGYALKLAPLFEKRYEFYGRILDFNQLKKEMWKENGIAEGLIMHFGHPNKVF
jgi:hypothetical protein